MTPGDFFTAATLSFGDWISPLLPLRRCPFQKVDLSAFIAHATAALKICLGIYRADVSTPTAFFAGSVRTAGFIVVSKVTSSISLISDRRKCRREGYKMHHTSLDGRCFLAEARNEAAPGNPNNVVLNYSRDGKAYPV